MMATLAELFPLTPEHIAEINSGSGEDLETQRRRHAYCEVEFRGDMTLDEWRVYITGQIAGCYNKIMPPDNRVAQEFANWLTYARALPANAGPMAVFAGAPARALAWKGY